jgi:two-component system, NtrC family, nitrogen regulation sensor histidine kinase GlnL
VTATASHPKVPTAPTAPAPPSWADALATVDDAIILLDAAGRVAELTPAAEQLLQISPSHAIGNEIGHLLSSHTGNAWLSELCHHTLQPGALRRRSEGLLSRGRHDVPVLASCAPVQDAHGVVRGTVLILHDQTLQRELEAQTRRADRLANLGTVTLGLAHEIRNPLGGIKGAAQLLQKSLESPDQREFTQLIVREVERLDELLAQMRRLSQPHPLTRRPINVHRVLTEVLTLQRAAPAWGAVTLRTEFDPSLPPVDGDHGQLTQVFLNLCKNAVESMNGRGQLLIVTQFEHAFHIRRATNSGRLLSVLIEDTGPGVPPAEQPDLFTPFFTTKGGGTGLGLAICHRIVTEHGGSITYEDRPTGGARFRVTLPLSDHDDGND